MRNFLQWIRTLIILKKIFCQPVLLFWLEIIMMRKWEINHFVHSVKEIINHNIVELCQKLKLERILFNVKPVSHARSFSRKVLAKKTPFDITWNLRKDFLRNSYVHMCKIFTFQMAAFNKRRMLAIAILIMRRRRRRRQICIRRSNWIRPTNIDRKNTGAYVTIFLRAKEHDRQEFFR